MAESGGRRLPFLNLGPRKGNLPETLRKSRHVQSPSTTKVFQSSDPAVGQNMATRSVGSLHESQIGETTPSWGDEKSLKGRLVSGGFATAASSEDHDAAQAEHLYREGPNSNSGHGQATRRFGLDAYDDDGSAVEERLIEGLVNKIMARVRNQYSLLIGPTNLDGPRCFLRSGLGFTAILHHFGGVLPNSY